MPTLSSEPRIVMITGASSGIGAALARVWADQGARLVLLARRPDRLEALAAELKGAASDVLVLVCDVTRDGALEEAVLHTIERFGRIDVVVANAGFGVVGSVEKLTLEDYRRQFETNVFGVLRTVQASLEALKASRGSLAIVGSVNGYISLPGGTPYAMSKYAVRALTEGLWFELKSSGVSVTHVAPGFIESEIRSVNNRGQFRKGRRDPVPAWLLVPAEKAARQIVRAIDKRKREAVITGHGKLVVWLQHYARWLPRLVIARRGVRARQEP